MKPLLIEYISRMHHLSSSFNDSIFSLEYDHLQAGCSHISHSPIAGQSFSPVCISESTSIPQCGLSLQFAGKTTPWRRFSMTDQESADTNRGQCVLRVSCFSYCAYRKWASSSYGIFVKLTGPYFR